MTRLALVFILAVILFSSASLMAVESSSFEFMLMGPGSRASAMGEAFTAVSGDAGAPFFNPASAGMMNGSEVSLLHVRYMTDATLEHLAVLTRSGKVRYGLGIYLGKVSNFARRGDIPIDNPSYFDEHNFTGSIFWAVPLNERLAIGNAIKWAYEKIDISSANALAVDLGAFYTLNPQIALGASVRNLGTKPKFETVSYDLPRELRIGASFRTQIESRFRGLILASDFVLPKWGNGKSKINFGTEYTYQNFVALRIGYSRGYDSRGLSFGGGLTYQRYNFDYAFVPGQNNLSDTHRFTLRIKF